MKGPHAPALRSPESQVTLVGVLFLVWGGITILIGVSTLALGVAAASLITAAADAGRGQVAAGLTAATFTLFATRSLAPQYLRYLERKLREAFDLGPSPIKIRVRRRNE